jgi:hypothetical protein
MTSLYVYAFTERPVRAFTACGRRLQSLDVAGLHVVVDRAQPESTPSEDALRRQHAVVEAIARRCDPMLPARFGSSIDRVRLETIVAGNREVLRAALDAVRGRQQMTLRLSGVRAPAASHTAASAGRAYLARKRAELLEPDPALLASVHRAVGRLVRAERVQPGRAGLRPVVFHLVDVAHTADHLQDIEGLTRTLPPETLIVSGPWPPFAFTPELLG